MSRYTTVKGDTLYVIAKRCKVALSDISIAGETQLRESKSQAQFLQSRGRGTYEFRDRSNDDSNHDSNVIYRSGLSTRQQLAFRTQPFACSFLHTLNGRRSSRGLCY